MKKDKKEITAALTDAGAAAEGALQAFDATIDSPFVEDPEDALETYAPALSAEEYKARVDLIIKRGMMMLKGKKYLPVQSRLEWFRLAFPAESGWGITTEPIEINIKEGYAIYRAMITDPKGRVITTGEKMESKDHFGDYVEKAATGAQGRALAAAGFGTQFDPSLYEGERIVDSPVESGGYKRSGGYSGGAYERPSGPVATSAPAALAKCEGVIEGEPCGKEIPMAAYELSKKYFKGQGLCVECQKRNQALRV